MGAQDGPEPHVTVEDVEASQIPIEPKINEFFYKGQYWCVPENFELPKETKRLNGWRMWLCGQVAASNNVSYRLKPFLIVKGQRFPKKSVYHDLTIKGKKLFGIKHAGESLAQSIFRRQCKQTTSWVFRTLGATNFDVLQLSYWQHHQNEVCTSLRIFLLLSWQQW